MVTASKLEQKDPRLFPPSPHLDGFSFTSIFKGQKQWVKPFFFLL